MEFSDSESDEPRRYKSNASEKSIAHLKVTRFGVFFISYFDRRINFFVYEQEENDSLRCQLEAYKNEVEIVRSDLKLELQMKEQHIKTLEKNLTEERLKSMKDKSTSLPIQLANSADANDHLFDDHYRKLISIPSKLFLYLQNLKSHLLSGLLSVFLSVQRHGTSLNDAYEFVRKSDSSCTKEEVEKVLLHNKELFSFTSDLWRFKLFFL